MWDTRRNRQESPITRFGGFLLLVNQIDSVVETRRCLRAEGRHGDQSCRALDAAPFRGPGSRVRRSCARPGGGACRYQPSDSRRSFVVYLASHNQPVHEVLAPALRDITGDYDGTFRGMTAEPVALEARQHRSALEGQSEETPSAGAGARKCAGQRRRMSGQPSLRQPVPVTYFLGASCAGGTQLPRTLRTASIAPRSLATSAATPGPVIFANAGLMV